MNASGSRMTEDINLEEFERRLRAASAQQANAEDPLAELTRLVESARFGISDKSPAVEPVQDAVPGPVKEEEPSPSLETGTLRPTIDEARDIEREVYAEPQASEPDAIHSLEPSGPANEEGRRSRSWALKVSALAVAGVAMLGGVFALKGGVPGIPKDPPFIAAAQGPTKVQPPSDETVTTPNDANGTALKDNGKPASVKVVNTEEQPVDLSAQTASTGAPPAAANPPPAADEGKPPAAVQNATPIAATANTPVIAPAAPAPPPMASQFPDPKPVRTVSLRPDGTPIETSTSSPTSTGDQTGTDAAGANAPPASAPTANAPPANAPAKPPARAASGAGAAQPSTPKLELPMKSPEKSSARVVVAKTDTTAPEAGAQTPSEPAQTGAATKPEKAAKKPKPAQTVAEGAAAATTPVDATAATASTGWAVQLAAPKSEAEAQSELARLNAKYGADLNGSPLGVHKAVVNGETIYRLRVVGLTKADAAALCARLKGDGGECFIAK